MKNDKRSKNIEMFVGLFVLMGFVTLAVFTIIIGGDDLLKKQYSYEVVFDEVGGLQEGDSVYLRGKKVGYVKDTLFDQNDVIVNLLLDTDIQFKKDYRIEVGQANVLGGKLLNVYLGNSTISLPEKTLLVGSPPIDVMGDFNIAVHNLKNILDAIGDEEGTLGQFIFDKKLYNELSQLTADLGSIIGKIESGDGTIGKLIAEDSLYNNTEELVSFFNDITGKVLKGEGPLGQLLDEDVEVIQDLQKVVQELNIAMAKLNSTNGTIGKLLNDPELYDESAKIIDGFKESPLRWLMQ